MPVNVYPRDVAGERRVAKRDKGAWTGAGPGASRSRDTEEEGEEEEEDGESKGATI